MNRHTWSIVAAILLATGFFSVFHARPEASAIVSGDDPDSLRKGPEPEWKRGLTSSVREDYVKYRLEEGYFECEVPGKWIDIRDRQEDKRTGVYGMLLVPKNSRPGPKPVISVDYYAPGNSYFGSAGDYLKRQYEPPFFKLEGNKIGEMREAVVNGGKARQFSRDTVDYWPPHSMDTKKIRMHEECTVLEAKEGFFVLMYKAPDSQFTIYRPDYQHVLDTFGPFPHG